MLSVSIGVYWVGAYTNISIPGDDSNHGFTDGTDLDYAIWMPGKLSNYALLFHPSL